MLKNSQLQNIVVSFVSYTPYSPVDIYSVLWPFLGLNLHEQSAVSFVWLTTIVLRFWSGLSLFVQGILGHFSVFSPTGHPTTIMTSHMQAFAFILCRLGMFRLKFVFPFSSVEVLSLMSSWGSWPAFCHAFIIVSYIINGQFQGYMTTMEISLNSCVIFIQHRLGNTIFTRVGIVFEIYSKNILIYADAITIFV